MKKISSLILLLFILLSFSSFVGASEVVTSYNTPPEWANWKEVQRLFIKETGIFAPPDNKNSGQTLTALIAEKNNPMADVAYYGVTYGIKAVELDLTESYKPKYWNSIPVNLKDPSGKWFTIHSGTIVFQVNKDALGDIPVPRSWRDLQKNIYKGKIGFLDPTSAFVGYAVVTAANIALGGDLENWDPAISYFRKLKDNNFMQPKQTSYAKVVQGEIPIMIGYDFNGYRMKYDDNVNLEVVIPAEGTLTMPYVISLVKNAPHKENGKKFLDFIMSDQGQRAFAKGFVRPIRPEAMDKSISDKFLPQEEYKRAKAIDYKKMAEVMETVKKRWINEVLN